MLGDLPPKKILVWDCKASETKLFLIETLKESRKCFIFLNLTSFLLFGSSAFVDRMASKNEGEFEAISFAALSTAFGVNVVAVVTQSWDAKILSTAS